MNVKKYPSTDPQFMQKVRGACNNDYERGIVFILSASGMHVSNLVALYRGQRLQKATITNEGDLRWRRVKNNKPMSARVPVGDRPVVEAWLSRYPYHRSERSIQYRLKDIGARAGFPDLSPMSFRVQRACDLLDLGMSRHEVKHLLGCSSEVIDHNYSILQDARRVG